MSTQRQNIPGYVYLWVSNSTALVPLEGCGRQSSAGCEWARSGQDPGHTTKAQRSYKSLGDFHSGMSDLLASLDHIRKGVEKKIRIKKKPEGNHQECVYVFPLTPSDK